MDLKFGNKDRKILCIYHADCSDGFGAAWVVRKALGDVEFFPGVYQTPPPDVCGKAVILVDFSYKRDVILEMAGKAMTILILDHHKTAEEELVDLPENVEVVFRKDHSGAMIAWDYFFSETQPPKLLMHIEDRDLWKFALEDTQSIMSSVFSHPYNFDVWDTLMDTPILELAQEGVALSRKHHSDIQKFITKGMRRMLIGGYAVPVVNLPGTFASDAGHLLSIGSAFGACYWDIGDGRVFSLRSSEKSIIVDSGFVELAGSKENAVDVSVVSKLYGGGGHHNAAGFKVPFPELITLGLL